MIFYAKVKGKVSKFHSHDRGGHLISEPKFKIPTPPPLPPANFCQVPKQSLLHGLLHRHVQLGNPVRNYYQIKTMLRATFKNW